MRVVIHQVEIRLRIILIHRVVPIHRIDATHESAIDDRQFPVFTVVDLSAAGEDQCEPESTLRVRSPGTPVFGCLKLLAFYDTVHVQAHWGGLQLLQTVGLLQAIGLLLCGETLQTCQQEENGHECPTYDVPILSQCQSFILSIMFITRSSSSSLLNGMLIFPLLCGEHVICTFTP